MNKKSELLKNTIIILIGKISTQFITFLLLPLYTYFLTTNEYGTFDLITTYVILLAPLLSLQLENSMFRFLIDKRDNQKEQQKIVTNSIVVILVVIIILLMFTPLLYYIIKIKYLIYIIGIIITTIFVNCLLQISRGLGNNLVYSKSSVIIGVINIVMTLIFLLFTKFGIAGLFIANIVANGTCIIYLSIKLKINNKIKFKMYDKKLVIELIKYSLPLIPNSIMWWVINVSDRTIISIFMGTSYNGIYAVSNKFSTMFVSLYNVFNLSWQESAALNIENDNDGYFNSTFNDIIISFSSIVIMMISFMFLIFKILINEKYIDAYNYIPILLIASLFNVIVAFLGGIYIAKKKTKEVAKTSLYSAVINFILNILLIKMIGIYAAAISTLVAFVTMSVYRYIDVQKYVRIKFNQTKMSKTIIVLIISCILYYSNNIFLYILNICIAVFHFTIVNKKIILKIINKFLKKRGVKNENK